MVQRWILIAGAVLIILMGLFPPYAVVMPAVELNGKKHPEKVIAVGYSFIFDPPAGFDPDSFASVAQAPAGGNTPLESELLKIYKPRVPQGPERLQLVRIDVVRLGVQLGTVTLIAIGLLAYAFRPNPRP
jgi:hypothetical protein